MCSRLTASGLSCYVHEFAFLNIKLQIVFVNPVGDVINVLLQQCIISCACNWSIKQHVVSIQC